MIVLDASCLVEVLVGSPAAPPIRERLFADSDPVAPHVIDVEVLGAIRKRLLLGDLDTTAANQAIEDLQDWPVERFSHRHFLPRAWELRHNVRGWDAFYVALAEVLEAPLITGDVRLSRVQGLRCTVEVFPSA